MPKSLRRPRGLIEAFDSQFTCPSYLTRQLPPSCKQFRDHLTRKASTLSSTTAINASKRIPTRLKPLHTALGELRKKASAYVSLSRLQLAEQGLESESPKIRIAILGFNVQDTAKRVTRLLLADALESEQDWEQQLLNDPTYKHGVLIRYGQHFNSNLPQPRTSIPTLNAPVAILDKYNLEILVSSISSGTTLRRETNGQTIPAETFLAPTIGTPTAASGRQTIISQPVHGSLVVVDGLDELMDLAELLASTNFQSEGERASIRLVISQQGPRQPTNAKLLTLDPEKAEAGLEAIRRSIGEATTFEHEWVDSGLPTLSTWLAQASDFSTAIPQSLKRLLSATLNAAESNIKTHAASNEVQSNHSQLLPASKTNLQTAVDDFSRHAHSELQSGLSSAWSSRNWRKLAWYKLFWRVDDVGLIVNDLISNAWLPRTERATYELCGRFSQAGISPFTVTRIAETSPALAESPVTSPVSTTLPIVPAQISFADQPVQEPVILNPGGSPTVSMIPVPRPIPLSAMISITRTQQITRSINDLTFTAQQLVFRALSISGVSAGLSGLTYFTLTPGSLYEAATIAALGTAFALYRMQGLWQRATKSLEEHLFSEGRALIQKIVAEMRELINDDGQRSGATLNRTHTEEAMQAVKHAQAELEKLINQPGPQTQPGGSLRIG